MWPFVDAGPTAKISGWSPLHYVPWAVSAVIPGPGFIRGHLRSRTSAAPSIPHGWACKELDRRARDTVRVPLWGRA